MKRHRLLAKIITILLLELIVSASATSNAERNVSIASNLCDNFTSPSLGSAWTWVDPLGDSGYSLTTNPGFLRLFAPGDNNDLYLNLNAPRMMQTVTGDFTIKTKVTISPIADYQGAGLLVWQDSDNYIRLELNSPARIINYSHRINGTYFDVNPDPSNNGSSTAFLQIAKSGHAFSASFSTTGSSWQNIYTVNFNPSSSLQVGLSLLNQWQDNPINATFDFFEINGACATSFSDDFSVNPNISGKWFIYRSADDASNEGSWDSIEQTLYLTRAAQWKAIAMFANFELTSSHWEAQFRYREGGGSGADGLVFMFYKNKSPYTPGAGGFLGFQPWDNLTGISGYGIEFDNWQNVAGDHGIVDPSGNHIALINDSVNNHVKYVNDPRTEDNIWHNTRVRFENGHVVVSVDNGVVLDHQLPNVDYTYSGVGFSSATGNATNNHVIDDFVLQTDLPSISYQVFLPAVNR